MPTTWEIVRIIISVIIPVSAGFWFFIRKYIHKVDKVETEQGKQHTRISVIESKVDDMREDIKEIKHNVERLLDRR